MIDTHCLAPESREELAKQGYMINATSRWLPYSENSTGVENNSRGVETYNSLLHQKCLYFTSGSVTASVYYVLSSFFTSTVTSNHLDEDSLPCSFEGSQILQHIYNSGRINFDRIQETFSNISDSLTTYIRTHGNGSTYSDPAIGQVFHYATCIQVKWQWMAFPSSITMLTIVLFMATICSKPLARFPVWKTSFLPWRMRGPGSVEILNEDELEETSYNIDDMVKKSKDIRVTWKHMPNPHIQL
ncbi:hypothetical protein F4781DRAFT_105828 [Annulohypoxylon bovei var. microspora]|nr:hypothetical protein F4781DRAFT_105828 [Annulohypoxylon bovei var. microspora]